MDSQLKRGLPPWLYSSTIHSTRQYAF